MMMDSSLPTPSTCLETLAPDVSIIIPARNEEANLGACLQSLSSQTGVVFEIILVDDASTDRTLQIAQSFSRVRVLTAGALPADGAGKRWTGKNNALVAGSFRAHANWLLFTDADTIHLPGSLARALKEAESEKADLLSYSPGQTVGTFSERAVMPVIFSELAARYPPSKVRDLKYGIVAANGQYILVRRTAYKAVGGHAAVAWEILEDVALAKLLRSAGFHVHFRYGGDAVRARMYRNWKQLREGWTKNLALLFPESIRLALRSLVVWLLSWAALIIAIAGASTGHPLRIGLICFWALPYQRIRSARFSSVNNMVAIAFGLPMFAYLLLRSRAAYKNGQVSWKGRAYAVGSPRKPVTAGVGSGKSEELRADN
jgi:glycosyltransferase involved in cell wall biosynthesis